MTLVFTSKLILPPLLSNSYLFAVSNIASFCFWVTTIVFFIFPTVRVRVTFLSSYPLFSTTFTVNPPSPALPFAGVTVHHVSPPIVLATETFQSPLQVNSIFSLPDCEVKVSPLSKYLWEFPKGVIVMTSSFFLLLSSLLQAMILIHEIMLNKVIGKKCNAFIICYSLFKIHFSIKLKTSFSFLSS